MSPAIISNMCCASVLVVLHHLPGRCEPDSIALNAREEKDFDYFMPQRALTDGFRLLLNIHSATCEIGRCLGPCVV